MKRLFLFFLILISCGSVSARISEDTTLFKIKFLVTSPDLPDSAQVYITGSIQDLGLWDPSKVVMSREGNHTWNKIIELKGSVSIEFKFTLGSWSTEAADKNGNPLPNFNLKVNGDTTVNINIEYWKKGDEPRVITGGITGNAEYLRNVEGAGILSRDVVIWLPPGYDTDTIRSYPVLYMHDGQNIFDPSTSSFGNDWKIDETCDSLINNEVIDPLIVVGIYNTSDRSYEYTPGEKGEAYMKFVVNTLKPIIDSAYRTSPERAHTLTGGSSAGGLISFMLAWKYPDIFSSAICMSPAFKIAHIDFVKVVNETDSPAENTFFYIMNGEVGLEAQLQPGVDEMISALNAKGFIEGSNYVYLVNPSGKHSEPDWAMHFPYAIIRCLSGK